MHLLDRALAIEHDRRSLHDRNRDTLIHGSPR
jgi:hypothetical protein